MLAWYADQIAAATGTVMFTAAFGVNKLLAAQFGIDRPFVRFILLEDEPDKLLKAKMAQDRDVVAAYGSILGDYAKSKKAFPPSSLDAWFLKEELFRKQGHVFFIHTKFLLIDPLSDNPLVCTGSANFSTSSLEANDENMLLIRGDTAVADVYLTEFDRIFRHFYARQVIDRLAAEGKPLTEAKFLDESDGWLGEYTQPGRLKTNRQRLFFPNWPGR
jgi:phosphatidylserine/phosphatidylglycerophosphate/cardiolipin synthase-like enzyme